MAKEIVSNLSGYVRLVLTLVLAGGFTKISMDRTGEFKLVAPVVGFFIAMMAVLGSEQVVRWLLLKKEDKIEDVKIAGTLVLAFILQAVFSLILGIGLFVVGTILGIP